MKPYTIKRDITKPYKGSVNVDLAFRLLRSGLPMREIARRLNKDKKTITLALKRVYGYSKIKCYLDAHNTKLQFNR